MSVCMYIIQYHQHSSTFMNKLSMRLQWSSGKGTQQYAAWQFAVGWWYDNMQR